MPRGALDSHETTAGQIVAQQLDGQVYARDIAGALDGTHDIDIRLADERVVCLEVTSAANGPTEALRDAALGREWKAPSLGYHWWLGVPSKADIRVKTLMTKVVPHLEVFERYGIEQVGGAGRSGRRPRDSAAQDVIDATQAVFALGADRATRLARIRQ